MPIDGDKLIKEAKEAAMYGTPLEGHQIPYSTSPGWQENVQHYEGVPVEQVKRDAEEIHRKQNNEAQRAQGISVLSGLGKSISQAALSNPVFQKLGFFGDVYQNTVGPNAPSTSKMSEALHLATMTGLTAQRIIENPEMYQDAQAEYGRAVRSAYLGGNGFSSEYIQQHYPELKTDDPVGAALALTNYKDILNTRAIVNWATHPLQSAIETGKYIKNSWHNGEVNEEMSDVMFRAAQGEISDAEAQRQLTELNKTKIDTGGSSSIVGDTVEQVSNTLNSMGRAARTDIAPLAPVLHDLTVLAPAAVASLGYMGTAALAGAGVTGAVAGAPAFIATAAAAGLTLESSLIYDSTYRQQLGQNYWSKINARGADGSPLYTHDTAVSEAKREAHLQAFIETAFAFTIFKPLSKMFGKEAALKIIENSVARKTMVEAGKKAFMKEAVKESAKVITYGAAEQVAQEGLEDLVTSADETITGRNPHTFKDAMRSAASAMIDAVPAAIGMMGVSGVIGGVGTYHGLTHHQEFIQAKMAKYGKESALQEVERESEANMVDHLLEARDKSKLNKEAPTQFAQVVGNQMKAQDMGTLYVDAATAVETPEGRKALGELEKSGLVTAEQVQQAVEKETPLAVDSGMYMQTVQQETADTLKEYSTFDKAGMTMHAIREERTRLSTMVKELSKTKDEREKDAVQSIMDTYFPNETDNTKKEVLQELFAGGVDRLGDNAQEMLSNARTTWGDITGYEQYADYDPKNPPEGTSDTAEWYNEAKQAYGHNPNKRELYDVAHKEYVKELQEQSRASLEEEKQQITQAMDDASQNGDTNTYNTLQAQLETVDKKLAEVDTNLHAVDTAKKRVEALEDIKNTLNKAGLKEDIMAKVLLSEDAYEKAYKPTVDALMQSNGDVQEAARDSALIYARMIDSLARNYKLPVENIVSTIQATNEGPVHRTELHSPVNSDVKADTLVTVVDLTEYMPEEPMDRKAMTAKVKELFVNKLNEKTADKKAIISLPSGRIRTKHVVNSSLFSTLNKPKNKNWKIKHQASLLALKELIQNSVLIESEENRKKDVKSYAYKYHHFYLPVKIKDKLYTIRIVGEELDGSKGATPIDVKLYDVIIKNKAHPSQITAKRRLHAKDVPLKITIAEMLRNVKDSNKQPYVNKDGTLAVRKVTELSNDGNEQNNSDNHFQTGGKYKGGYSPEANAIHLFAAADQSTMVHEAAHFYLTTLLNLEQAGVRNKQLISDLKTIRDWAGYSYEKMAEYKGTTLEKEFRQMEQDIIDGKEGAEERFLQERFARGFERYLQEGRAPTKELRGVFRRFKKTLMDIYRSIKIVNGRKAFFNNLEPVKISPEMKHIFDAMLATEDEINAWSTEQKVMEMDKVGLDFTKTEKENYENWKSNLKDTIHEKAMQKFMDEYRELTLKGIDDITRQKKEQVMKDLIKKQKIYQVEAMLEGDVFPTEKEKMDYLKEQGFPDRKAYEEALKQAGGSLEKRAQEAAEREKEKQVKSLLSKETIRQEANRMLNSPEGAQRLAKMEAQAMRRKVNAYIRQASMALLHLEQGKKDAHLDEDIKRRLGVEGVDRENNLSLKDKLAETVENLKIARQQLDRPMTEVRYEAESLLAGQSVEKSTNWKWWQNKQRKAASMASNAARKGNWHSASYWMMKKNVYAMAARMAQRNEDDVKAAISGKSGTFSMSYEREGDNIKQVERYGVKGILNRISRRDKPVRMSSNSRYFIQHLAYQMGLSRTDGIPPVDKNGFETEFSWNKLARELNPTAAMAADAAGNEFTVSDAEIDSRLRELFSADRPSDYRKMNLSAFKGAVEAIEVIYKLGRREYEGNSFHTIDGKDVSFSKASEAITQEIAKKFGIETDAFNEKLRASVKDELKAALTKITNAHTLPEVLIQRLGKSAEQYLYRPIDKAANVEKTMQMDAFKQFKEIFNIYSRKEWQAIRADKTIKFGRDEYGKDRYITKETLLSVALNMGTASNRERVLETYGMDTGPVLQVLDKELSAKDIRFVQAVWDHINSYWADLNAMNNRLYGRGIGKVEGIKFHLKNGELDGKYYPIRYDSETSVRTGDITINEQALQRMSGAGTFSIGMGSTKSRMLTSGGQNLITDLTVYPKHVSEVIHAIAMREASVDVYKLISDPDIKSAVVNGLGIDTYRVLRDWAQDNWKTPIERSGPLSKLIDALQSGNSYATMAFRNSTALLNILPNLGVFYRSMIRLSGDKMMEGAFRARRALASLYLTGNYAKQKEFIMEKSAFLRDRQSTLDADLERGFSLPGEKGRGKLKSLIYDGEFGKNAIDKYAFWFIEKTDLLFSLPMWLETYKATRDSYIGSKLTTEQIDAEAVAKADQMVRQYYGSGEIKDRSPVMKNKVIHMFTPFYTYSATMLNRFIESGYLAVDSHNYKPLVLDTLCLGLLVGSMEGLTRYAMNRATGKDDSLWEEIVNSVLTGNFVQGIIIVRDMVSGLVGLALGKYSDTSSEVAGFRAQENLCNAIRFMASPKKNWIDVGQALNTAANRITHTPDTLTDALWATLRMATGDTDATLSEYLASMALDRKLKRSKEQLKKEAAERRAEKEEQDVEEPEQEESDD